MDGAADTQNSQMPARPRRKNYEDNPTMQQIELTQEIDSTYKNVNRDFNTFAINLDEKIE